MANITETDSQLEVLDFLADPASYPHRPASVERHETHGAVVFLAGEEAFKIKRAVSFPYMDFSTRERRRLMCEREVAINQPHAPDLYLGVVAITRESDGRLSLGGSGTAVEWAVHMRRFEEAMLISNIARQGALEAELIERIADAIAAYHRSAPRLYGIDGARRLERDLIELELAFANAPDLFDPDRAQGFALRARQHLERVAACLRRRGEEGFLRRCHGDLHLRNIVLWQGAPVLFDAIEFNNEIASLDTLYDLAFLLMDLDRNGQRAAANRVLGRYLWRSRAASDLDALAALPLMLALRAGIRAMVAADRARQQAGGAAHRSREEAGAYFAAGDGYLDVQRPRLIAIGGLSGSGKSTLAAALAPHLAPAPGALHLRSDLERKALFNAEPTERLPAQAYTSEVTSKVYASITEQARRALTAGHSVIADAVFGTPEERTAIEKVAADSGAAFDGVWLTAPAGELKRRVALRMRDASDATTEVVEQQLRLDTGRIAWPALEAGGSSAATLAAARARLGV
ncbi:MAG TPA: AAA family ATPase [Hyphomicrobiaceae bacterium]|nr:AAA family ATPase [Hyphomicrobiaceae bacterium]